LIAISIGYAFWLLFYTAAASKRVGDAGGADLAKTNVGNVNIFWVEILI